jgi:hypothetical protein
MECHAMPTSLAPDIEKECPIHAPADILAHLEKGIAEKYARFLTAPSELKIDCRLGPQTAFVHCQIGPPNFTHDFHFFTRDVPGSDFDGALGVLVDFLDGSLEQFFAADRDASFPLDYTGHPFGKDYTVFARSSRRDIEAEDEANRFLRDHGENLLLDSDEF